MTRAIAGLILLAGLALRLPGLADPPLDFHATRQYRGAILARGYALDRLDSGLSEPQRLAARLAARAAWSSTSASTTLPAPSP